MMTIRLWEMMMMMIACSYLDNYQVVVVVVEYIVGTYLDRHHHLHHREYQKLSAVKLIEGELIRYNCVCTDEERWHRCCEEKKGA